MFKDFLGLEVFQLPVVVAAEYELSDDMQSASIILRSINNGSLAVTIIHESIEVAKQELHGDDRSEPFQFRDGEAMVILARRNGDIVACGMYQANLGLYDTVRSILIPVATSNLDVIQDDVRTTTRVAEYVLEVAL